MYFLVDCNNFYASCEQLFNPAYRNKPIVVLSNNDGCVVARSKQAKALKIPMGAPHFKWREHFLRHNVIVLSSNFALYADLSQRVIATLESFKLPMEAYSIDESFLKCNDPALAHEICSRVYQWTGIPVSIGIGSTKTLAKLANHIAKKNHKSVHKHETIPENFPIEEIWGIGSRIKKTLHSYGIQTVQQFLKLDETWIKKNLTVTGLRTLLELKGTPCHHLNEVAITRKSILCSRSFTDPLTTRSDLSKTLSTFIAKASKTLRKQELQTNYLTIFLSTNRFQPESYYSNSASCRLAIATNSTPKLITQTKSLLKQIYLPNREYKRAGILLTELSTQNETQLDLLIQSPTSKKEQKALAALDQINQRYGARTLHHASEKRSNPKPLKSNAITTSWEHLPKIKI